MENRREESPSVPSALEEQILAFLELGVSLDGEKQRKLLLVVAELGEDLESAISLSGTTAAFCRNLLTRLVAAGRLTDGRWALDSLFKAAVRLAALENRASGEAVLAQLLAWRRAPTMYQRLTPSTGAEPIRAPSTEALNELARFVLDPPLKQLRGILQELSKDHRPQICLIHGAEGTGKTELLKAVSRMEFGRRTWWYSWRSSSSPLLSGLRLAQSSGPAPPLIQQICHSLEEMSGANRLRDLRPLREQLRAFNYFVRDQVEGRLKGQPELTTRVGQGLLRLLELGGLVALSLVAQPGLPSLSIDSQLFADVLGTTAETLKDMVELLRRCLGPAELRQLDQPRRELVALLARTLLAQAQRQRPFWVAVDGFDRYSYICKRDFEDLVRLCGPGFIWFLTSRQDLTAQADFVAFKARLDLQVHSIPLRLLAERDILQALRQIHRPGPHWLPESFVALEADARRIHALTHGRFPDVANALSTWARRGNLERELLAEQMGRLEQPMHAESRRLVFAFLRLRPWIGSDDRGEILHRMFPQLEERVSSLIACCPAVSESQHDILKLDRIFESKLLDYLARPVVKRRDDIRQIHTTACHYLEEKRRAMEGERTPPAGLFTNPRWREVSLALAFHLFHLDPDLAWYEVPRLVAACRPADELVFRGRLLEMLRSVTPTLGTAHEERFRRVESALASDTDRASRERGRKEILTLAIEGVARQRLPPWDWPKLVRGSQSRSSQPLTNGQTP
jgi:hypothetical protein